MLAESLALEQPSGSRERALSDVGSDGILRADCQSAQPGASPAAPGVSLMRTCSDALPNRSHCHFAS
jgi:hypothetical protein